MTDERGSSTGAVPVGGDIRRVAILTTRLGTPCAHYLARRLQAAGVELYLVTQMRLKVAPDSWAYFKRLYRKRGFRMTLDYALLYGVKLAVRTAQRLVGKGRARSGQPTVPALRDDPRIKRESWLTCVETSNVNRGDGHDRLREIAPDLILLAGAPILSRRTIALARVACINPHAGITPDYAGSSPPEWTIYERRFTDIGYTVHLVVPAVDSGSVIHQEHIEWDASLSIGHVWSLLAQKMYDKLADVALALIRGEKIFAVPQGKTRINAPAGLFTRMLAEWRRMRFAATKKRGATGRDSRSRG